MRISSIVLILTLLVTSDTAKANSVLVYREGIRDAARSVASIRPSGPLLSRAEKLALWSHWNAFLDYLLALDSLAKNESLGIRYVAFLASYRGATEMIEAAGRLPAADTILNDAVPEIGLPRGTYSRVKFRFLNVARAAEYSAFELLYRTRGAEADPRLRAAIEEDSRYVLALGRGKGQVLTAANAVKVVESSALRALFPVQKGVAEWMGDTRVARHGRALITAAQIAGLKTRLEPGDILLERREWYLSNIGLPGFWPHAALYVGDAEERRRYFGGEAPELRNVPAGARVIEAISEGVSFTTLEYSAAADSLAVLRPRLSKREKAAAIARAAHYVGRPYDFDFNFDTDASLVCSEVIYRAYEDRIRFPVAEVAGRKTMPPNNLVRDFDTTFGTPRQQFDLIVFFDGRERERRAVEAPVAEFRSSAKRPKWHILK